MKIPNHEQAFIDIRKLEDYSLSATHPVGKHKAKVFAEVLGLTAEDAELLRSAILEAVDSDRAAEGELDEYGQRYTLDFPMISDTGREAIVRSTWIIRQGEDFPRLTSCYVL